GPYRRVRGETSTLTNDGTPSACHKLELTKSLQDWMMHQYQNQFCDMPQFLALLYNMKQRASVNNVVATMTRKQNRSYGKLLGLLNGNSFRDELQHAKAYPNTNRPSISHPPLHPHLFRRWLPPPPFFALNGKPGTGKTYTTTTNTIITALKTRMPDAKIICGAMTGSAGANLPGGLTLHRDFKLSRIQNTMPENANMPLRELNEKDKAELHELFGTDPILIVDEYSMVHQGFIGMMDERLFQITGKQMHEIHILLIGDNFQLPAIANPCLYQPLHSSNPPSNFEHAGKFQFEKCLHLRLTQIMRSGPDLTHSTNIHAVSDPMQPQPLTTSWATTLCPSNKEAASFKMILSKNYCTVNGHILIMWHSTCIGQQNANTQVFLDENTIDEGMEVFVANYKMFVQGNTYLYLQVARLLAANPGDDILLHHAPLAVNVAFPQLPSYTPAKLKREKVRIANDSLVLDKPAAYLKYLQNELCSHYLNFPTKRPSTMPLSQYVKHLQAMHMAHAKPYLEASLSRDEIVLPFLNTMESDKHG
ncbi:hypothetical protein HDU98_004537, partial [Podochytrium sp. JEL0797]